MASEYYAVALLMLAARVTAAAKVVEVVIFDVIPVDGPREAVVPAGSAPRPGVIVAGSLVVGVVMLSPRLSL